MGVVVMASAFQLAPPSFVTSTSAGGTVPEVAFDGAAAVPTA
jgi:hypothetical protein